MLLYRANLKKEFDKYMLAFYRVDKQLTFGEFSHFAATLLNYYVSTQIIQPQDKLDAAYYLTSLYNKATGNRILEQDMATAARSIADDYSMDQRLLGEILE